ncbi:MAG: DNA topoisomerase I, partial [Deltaproteobacteria bacterium]|nr:DNA topoisomerase I [Deltaproteobacteria bacterium]
DTLDGIAAGQPHIPYLKGFYFGNDALPGLSRLIQAEIDPRQACTIPLCTDSENRQVNIRVGKYGPYLERGEERASLPVDLAPDDITREKAEALLARGNQPDVLGMDPVSGKTVFLKTGRFGPYVQLGEPDPVPEPEAGEEGKGEAKPKKRGTKKVAPPKPKMKSLLPDQTPETLTLDQALALLSLPRLLGEDPATGEDVVVDLGRFGPYAIRGRETRSLASTDALFSMTLGEAQALFAQPKAMRRGQAQMLRELGPHPVSGEPVRLMAGRFGPYATDGEINASLPRGEDPAGITLETALALLAARAAKGPPVKKRFAKKPAKPTTKATAKPATKTTTKKSKKKT